MLEVEKFNIEKHYPILKEWWDKQWPTAPPTEILPPLGLVVKENGVFLYGIFLYDTGTPIAWIEYIVGNPDVHPSKKRGALKFGVAKICDIAKRESNDRLRIAFSSSNNPAFINSMRKCGFQDGDKDMTQLIKTF